MPDFDVTITPDDIYTVTAPDEKTAYQWARSTYMKEKGLSDAPPQLTRDSNPDPGMVKFGLQNPNPQEGGSGPVIRGLTEGALSIPSLLSGPIIKFVKTLGIDPHLPGNADTVNGAMESLFNDLGIPSAQSEPDKLVQAAAGGLGGTVGGFGLGNLLRANGLAPKTAESLLSDPAKQLAVGAASSTAGQGAADAAAKMGADERTQGVVNFLASLGTGVGLFVPGSAMQAATKIALGKDDGSALGTLLKLGVRGNKDALAKIAELSAQNPELVASAQRLGINLPPDVTSTNPTLQAAVGQARSKIGQNSAEWGQTLREIRDKGDEIMQKVGAVYGQAGPSLSDVSGSVRDTLLKSSDQLKAITTPLYEKIDAAMPLPTRVQAPATVAMIKEMGDNVGGIDKLSPDLQRLYANLTSNGGPTFGYLKSEIGKVGQDVGKRLGNKLYPNTDDVSLGQIYDSLKADREGAIRSLGDPSLNQALDEATNLYRQKKQLDEKVVNLFGDGLSKNLEGALSSSLSADARGKSSGKFLEILSQVPADQKKEVVATALASISHSAGYGGGFDITKFANNYRALRDNKATYSAIANELGQEGHDFLADLYKVSDATSKAMQLTSKTGASLQNPAINALESQGIISNFLESATGRTIASGVGGALGSPGGFVGSAIGAGATSALSRALAGGSSSNLEKLGQLFASRKFQQLILDASNADKQALVNASTEFQSYAKAAGIPPSQRTAWLAGLLKPSKQEGEKPPQMSATALEQKYQGVK